MTQAITRCPSCGMSFRVSESQLRVADGAVRCGACLSVFQAENFFISPPLDVTEQLAIQQDYWADFEEYVYQVLAGEAEQEQVSGESVQEETAPEIATEETRIVQPAEAEEEPVEVEVPLDYDLIPVLSEEITAEEIEEAFAAYADAGLIPQDTVTPVDDGQQDLFDRSGQPLAAEPVDDIDLAGVSAAVVDVEDPEYAGIVTAAMEAEIQNTGVTITATRDSRPDEDPGVVAMALGIETDPEEITAPRRGGITNAMLGWAAASGVMILVGLLQFAFFNMDTYAQNERYRPYYVNACRYLGCEVPPYDRIELLRTRELIVRTHPSAPDALMVDVLLSNNGDFRQLFPGLELTFFNIQGEKAASRVFTVSEYLGGELRGLRFIPARTEVRLSLELVDPGNEALGYEMHVVPL